MALFQLRTLCLCLLLLVFKTCIAGQQHKDRIYPGFQASQMDWSDNGGLFLLSNNTAFALGFYQALDVKLYLLVVIHLGTSKVVWTANRGSLISNSDKFAFEKNGNAYLRSSNDLVWSTNTTGEVVQPCSCRIQETWYCLVTKEAFFGRVLAILLTLFYLARSSQKE
ncbi:unnamed protein product [Prunus armeniaca]|uniref:Bulb-type lectin domain-containing protein n=1 Tax=Prunus armeniaca TaxID=36596 RepID=A0A6J5U8Q3_PRUAR|nr:unnamed protein product [Prunus armeniaca]